MAIFTWLLLVLLIANSFRKGLPWARDVWDIVGVKMRSEWWCEAWRWEKAVQIFRPAGMMGVCALHILSISLCSFLPSIIVETIELCKYLTLHNHLNTGDEKFSNHLKFCVDVIFAAKIVHDTILSPVLSMTKTPFTFFSFTPPNWPLFLFCFVFQFLGS